MAVTRWLREEAQRVAGDALEIVAVNAASGIAAIQTPAELEIAARAVISAISSPPPPAGAIIAAFGDPGLAEARARFSLPIVGLAESGMLAAADGRRFAIVTAGAALREMIVAKTEALGVAGRLVGIRMLPFSIPEMIADRKSRRDAIAAAVRACLEDDGAEAVLLGGAPFAGLAASLARETRTIVLDGVEASVVRIVAALERILSLDIRDRSERIIYSPISGDHCLDWSPYTTKCLPKRYSTVRMFYPLNSLLRGISSTL